MLRTPTRLVWCLVAVMAVITVVSFALTGLAVDVRSNPAAFALIGALLAMTWFYRRIRPDPRLQAASEVASQIFLLLLFGILLTYAAASTSFPYRDNELARIDLAMGFDRRAYLDFFNNRPWLGRITSFAYMTLLPQFVIVPLALLADNRLPRVQSWLLAVGIALLATSAISVFTPSLTAFVYSDLKFHVPPGVYTPMPTIEALRAGTFHTVRLDRLEGLVSFPSFHTTGALLFVWALWPLRYLRWAGLALNTALIAATPINGAHYLIDLAGGAVVAILALAASRWLCRHFAQPISEMNSGSALDPKSVERKRPLRIATGG